MRMIEAEIENFFSVQGIDQIALKQRSMLRKSLQVWYHPLQFRFEAIHSCHYVEQSKEYVEPVLYASRFIVLHNSLSLLKYSVCFLLQMA